MFAQFLAILQAIRSIAPVIPQAIQIAESLCPPGSTGATKLAMALSFVQNAYKSLDNAQVQFETMLPHITDAVNQTVAAYNAIGALKKPA